jgi:preprotein translocase subunit SecD
MNSNLKWKAITVAAVVLLCIYGLFGLPDFPKSFSMLKQNFSQRIRLGLDLQGGTHLILQVQVNEALRQETAILADDILTKLRAKNISSDQPQLVSDTQVKISNVPPDRIADFRSVTGDYSQTWDTTPAPGEANGYLMTMRQSTIGQIQDRTMSQSVETIRRRIDELGLTEPFVAPYGQGDNEIIVELPGETDPIRAKGVIQAGGQLEIRYVPDPTPYTSQAAALSAKGGILPPGTELLPGMASPSRGQESQTGESWYIVDRVPIIYGRDIRDAQPARNPDRPPNFMVKFRLTVEAGHKFGPFTESHIGQYITFVLDRHAQPPAVLKGRIEDQGELEGSYTEQQATDEALIIRAGALPASIKYLEESTVGASLGADSIRHGYQASITSLIVVLIFMVVYYRSAGVNAVVALLLNLVILLAALAYFEATLSLPGIAGVILTIGMGVDSNVLIFERIREELRGGKAPASAVDLGFKRAFLTIIDTHVTTVVSAAFLGFMGTGPVRGFAITLTIGLIANLFTSVYVSRLIFDWHLAKAPRQAELSI